MRREKRLPRETVEVLQLTPISVGAVNMLEGRAAFRGT